MNDPNSQSSDQPGALYESHTKIYPQSVKGTFRALKSRVGWFLLVLYFATPWLRWDRGAEAPGQAILLDIDGRRAHVFALEIWPQEIYHLTGLLIFGTVALFLATALLGRVWCGFTCPQTVWTDLFMWVGRIIEGDRNRRIKLKNAPLSLEKILKRILKHSIWLAISFFSALTFVLYFNDAPNVTVEILTGRGGPWVNATVALLTVVAYVFAGWMREQVCIYMCPWLRFQVAMFDEDSMIVTYEQWRGEPRGHARAGQSFDGRGHCVDCNKCVLVCPTGIDIRNGQQVACIGCALCIDACNSVMDKFDLPPGLIAYDSESRQVARAKGKSAKINFLRPRIMVYAAILVLIAGFMSFQLVFRANMEINVQADRSPLFVTLTDGRIRGGYTFKIINKKTKHRTFTLSLRGVKGATLRIIGYGEDDAVIVELPVGADKVGTFRVFIKAKPADLSGKSTDIDFVLEDKESGEILKHRVKLQGPAGNSL